MQDFGEKDLELIKTLQQIIIKNTAVLDKKTRSKVYSKFQSIGYSYVNIEEARKLGAGAFSLAFYSSKTNKIYIIKDKNEKLTPNVLLHEMIHSISDAQDWSYDNKKGYLYKSGIIENYSSARIKDSNICTIKRFNTGINEGFTEFVSSKFLDDESGSYPFEVHITKFLSDAIGFENLMNCYFNNDVNHLKKLIQDAFYLPNEYLIDKLFLQFDIICNYSKNGLNKYASVPIIKSCYETLIKMNIIKTQHLNIKNIKNEKDTFNFFDIRKYLNRHSIQNLDNLFNDLIANDLVDNQYHLFNDLKDDSGYKDIADMTSYIVQQIYNNNFSEIPYIIKSGKTCLKVLQSLNSLSVYSIKINDQLEPINKANIVKTFLTCLAGKNKKIDFQYFTESEKNEFILNCLYNPYDKNKENCEFIQIKDLLDFLNHGSTEYRYFMDDRPFERIKNYTKYIDSRIYFKSDFFGYIERKLTSKSQNEYQKEL